MDIEIEYFLLGMVVGVMVGAMLAAAGFLVAWTDRNKDLEKQHG